MISKELLPINDRMNLEADKWLLNTEFNQAKFFNELGHKFFKEGRYKKYKIATQLDVSKRLLFVIEKLEYSYEELNKKYEELQLENQMIQQQLETGLAE